jgi:hypothetical protein
MKRSDCCNAKVLDEVIAMEYDIPRHFDVCSECGDLCDVIEIDDTLEENN